LGGRLSVSGSHPRLLEIGPPGVSKKVAIATVAAKVGIPAADCAAAGDAENDLDMLAWAGMAVTVGNAVPEVKRLAQFVGPSCDDGGLADAVAWLMQRQSTLATADETGARNGLPLQDRKSTRLNSSHGSISYAVFCLKKKKKIKTK